MVEAVKPRFEIKAVGRGCRQQGLVCSTGHCPGVSQGGPYMRVVIPVWLVWMAVAVIPVVMGALYQLD